MVVPAFAMHALEKYASDQNWLPRGVAHPLQVDLDECKPLVFKLL